VDLQRHREQLRTGYLQRPAGLPEHAHPRRLSPHRQGQGDNTIFLDGHAVFSKAEWILDIDDRNDHDRVDHEPDE
jgi:hypothetical protein